ncbi:MAG: hypothetical protein U0903_10645 [Planctomycetales bacterium]
MELIDEVIQVSSDESFEVARRLMRVEGISFCRPVARRNVRPRSRSPPAPKAAGKTIVVILPTPANATFSTSFGEAS